jgi:hypothetical protein
MLAAVAALAGAITGGHAGAQESSQPDPATSPLAGNGMWIWYVSQSSHGDVGRIAKRAHRRGLRVVLIKAGDGSHVWSQFSSSLVSALHARGLKVCGWQFVYGREPKHEARVGAAAVGKGADCLVIDAESDYEGRYAKAWTYIHKLRMLIGDDYPVGLAGFPYVDYHPAYPYSVFLGPGGAQFNVPQLYWYTIGDKVDWAFAHTYAFNRVYRRPILPLGQVYANPPASQIRRFRRLAVAHEMAGVSWWSWQSASARGWKAIGPKPVQAPVGYQPTRKYPRLEQGSRGDVVVWAQQLLAGGGYTSKITGSFGPITGAAVAAFQADYGLEPTGAIGAPTWSAMSALSPLPIRWTRSGAVAASSRIARPEPRSAELPARGYEIPPELGSH